MNTTTKVITGVLAGISAGLITGILTAPDSGKNTRKKLVNTSKQAVEDTKDELNKQVERARVGYNDLVDRTADSAINGVKKTKEVISI